MTDLLTISDIMLQEKILSPHGEFRHNLQPRCNIIYIAAVSGKFLRYSVTKDLQNYCGISIYDKDTNKDGNLKQIGNTFYYRKKNKKGKKGN